MPRVFGYQVTSADTLYGPIALADNQSSATSTGVSFSLASTQYVQLQYGLLRNGSAVTGHLLITTDGTNVTLSNDDVETAALGITFSASVSGGVIYLNYTSTATGYSTAMTYYQKAWQN